MANKNFELVKSSIKIEDVAKDYVSSLKQAGANLKGLCPFHSEKTPSFTVSPAKQRYKCFGCGASGDVIDFVATSENLSLGAAMEKLANQYHVQIEKQERDIYYSGGSEAAWGANACAAQIFLESLSTAPRDYKKWLLSRGVDSREMAARWGIGYAPPQLPRQGLLAHFSEEEIRAAGLLRNGSADCFFGNRITFALIDIIGHCVGFAGRDMSGVPGVPKYINPADSDHYHKKDFLYGLHAAARHIKLLRSAIIVEGYFDVIMMHEKAGIVNTIATCGTELTRGQAAALARLTDSATIFWDTDVFASLKKLERVENAILHLWEVGIEVIILRHSDPQAPNADPADLAQTYRQDVLDACDMLQPAQIFKLLNRDLTTVAANLAQIKNITLLQAQLRDCCLAYGVNLHVLSRAVQDKKAKK